jgi:hypothetical protein
MPRDALGEHESQQLTEILLADVLEIQGLLVARSVGHSTLGDWKLKHVAKDFRFHLEISTRNSKQRVLDLESRHQCPIPVVMKREC